MAMAMAGPATAEANVPNWLNTAMPETLPIHENAKFLASLTMAKNKLESSISLLDRISDIDSSGATLKTAVEPDDDQDESALEPPEKVL